MDEWVVVSLPEIFTKEQLKELMKLVEDKKKRKINPLSTEYIKNLKELFGKWERELIEKGIYPDYLVYAVAFTISKNPELFLFKLKQAAT
jgi:DNA-binding protein H-NS